MHGSPAVVRARCWRRLAAMPGLRLAEPGEFTRRALLNGRLDLAQVEGLGDLLAAETAAQQRQALAADGRGAVAAGAGVAATSWCGRWPSSRRPSTSPTRSCRRTCWRRSCARSAAVHAAMQHELRGSRMAERIRDGFEVALVGRPNVGKSTLLNALAGREAALTSEVAGTTRDVIEVRMDLGGLPVTLLDMAGLRETGRPGGGARHRAGARAGGAGRPAGVPGRRRG